MARISGSYILGEPLDFNVIETRIVRRRVSKTRDARSSKNWKREALIKINIGGVTLSVRIDASNTKSVVPDHSNADKGHASGKTKKVDSKTAAQPEFEAKRGRLSQPHDSNEGNYSIEKKSSEMVPNSLRKKSEMINTMIECRTMACRLFCNDKCIICYERPRNSAFIHDDNTCCSVACDYCSAIYVVIRRATLCFTCRRTFSDRVVITNDL